jgi:hypothetical protein
VVFIDEIEKAFAGTGTDLSGVKTEMVDVAHVDARSRSGGVDFLGTSRSGQVGSR